MRMKRIDEKRAGRRNPMGAWREMINAGMRLNSGLQKFRKGKLPERKVLGKAMGFALAKARVRQMLVLDPKFKIENDAAFNERLFGFLRGKNSAKPFSLAIIDLDFLKRLNKKSYEKADNAIAILSAQMNQIAKRHKGFAGRFGGDELKIFLPAKKEILAAELNIARKKMNKKGFSFSGGVHGLENCNHPEQIVVASLNSGANKALRKSKTTGKNKIRIF